MVHEPATGLLFTSDAVHWRFSPAADGSAALPPTYEDVDPYLDTIALVESLQPSELHSGHFPVRSGAEVAAFLDESRAFVHAGDAVMAERLVRPASLRELCEHAEVRLGPFGADPVNLMFVVHGHLRRMLRRGEARLIDPAERPARFARP
jgi:glyoxylase-like metal-dependent hydrolase (beta-lactamase superfamily II)